MCINFGGSDNKKPAIKVPAVVDESGKKVAPKPDPGKIDLKQWEAPVNPEAAKQLKIDAAMGEGPAPTVMGAQKSNLALSNRRRKLIDAFKYGLSSQLLKRTTAQRG